MLNDIRYALRTLRQHPGFALTAILSIALAIGANSAIFSFQDGLLFRPLAIEKPSEVVTIASRGPTRTSDGFSYPDFVELRDKNRSFDGLVAYRFVATGFGKDEKAQPQFKVGFLVSGNFFDLLGVRPALGRGFRPDEDQVAGRDPVVVIAYDFWKSEFGADPSVIGKSIRLGPGDVQDFTIVGVAPESFTGMDLFIRPAFFVPVMMGPRILGLGNDMLNDRRHGERENLYYIKGRLKTGVPAQAANADIAALARDMETAFPDSNRGRDAAVRTEIQSRLDASPIIGGLVAAVFGVMVVILLVACANVANLMLARGRARSREMGVRLAIGAGRSRLVRQLMAENMVIALAGGALGLLIAAEAVRFFSTFELPGDTPIKFTFQLDARVLVFTLIVSIASAILFGLIPALQSTRTDLTTALKGGESIHARKRFLGRSALVVIQIAGALVMLLAAAQMYRNTSRVLTENPGFLVDHRITIRLDPGIAAYSTAQTEQFYRTLMERTGEIHGLKSAALSSGLPLTTDNLVWNVVPEGYQFPAGQTTAPVPVAIVDENYFKTLGVPILGGRGFRAADRANSPRVAIVNEAFATKAFGGNAIGKRIRLNNSGEWSEIVGMTSTGKYSGITEPPQTFVYVPHSQNPLSRMTLIAETSGDPAAMTRPLRDLIHSIDSNMPVFSVHTMEDVFQRGAVAQIRVFVVVFAATSLMGFVLAVLGLYAVVAYQVVRRTREIGIRMALGAQGKQVLRMILKQATVVAALGIGIGLLLSLAARPALMISMGRPASSFDPSMIGLVPVSLLLVTLLAAVIPARRAARIDPQQALRQD